MNPLDRLGEYLHRVEKRLRFLAWTRGAAVTAAVALIFTVVLVTIANYFAFSPTIAIFDIPSSPLTKPETKPVICRAWCAALSGPTRKMYL